VYSAKRIVFACTASELKCKCKRGGKPRAYLEQLRGKDEDEGDDRLALVGRCLLPPCFLSVGSLSPGLSLSSPSSSVPGICCLQTKMAVWKGCSTNTASSPLF